MHYVYVLRSLADGGMYIGSTADLRERIRKHNSGGTRSTRGRLPFELVYYEAYRHPTDARRREFEIKSSGQQREILKRRLESSLAAPPSSNG